jgi:hypothetical protein
MGQWGRSTHAIEGSLDALRGNLGYGPITGCGVRIASVHRLWIYCLNPLKPLQTFRQQLYYSQFLKFRGAWLTARVEFHSFTPHDAWPLSEREVNRKRACWWE